MMPATTAVCSGSPFSTLPARINRSASRLISISPAATASRLVTALSPTSTIRTSPRGPTCVRPLPRFPVPRLLVLAGIVVFLREVEREALQRYREVHALQLDVGRHFQRTRGEVENRLDAGRDHL